MKKFLSLMLIIVMSLNLTACNNNTQKTSDSSTIKMTEVKDVSVPDFKVKICGAKITNKDLEKYSLYSVESHTVNSQGTEHNYVFIGYKFSDVLESAQITGDIGSAQIICTDGYEMTYDGDVKADGVLLAITKDGETFKDGPWFAPCTSSTTGDFAQDLSKVEFGGITSPIAGGGEDTKTEETQEEIAFPQDPISEDKTDKITFADFSFKINGNEITNADLDGLKIYRNTVVTKNSKDVVSQNKYSGYVLKDVLAKLGISGTKVTAIADDGYTSELTEDIINNDLTIIAIEKDKETGKGGTVWIAPCAENSSGKYGKGIVEIVVE
ncbi:MAG: hypothetical protein Q4F12_04470 [Erysipelotrichaceae bacterium]|nr:hypothetical protein [Erysipelotrichaceae bacterium]